MNSKELSKLAGVSRSTFSRVINGHPNVSLKAKKSVMDTITKYGYTPNNAARNLKGIPSNILGMYFISMGESNPSAIHSSPFFSEFLVYLVDDLKSKGFQLLVSVISNISDIENMKNQFKDRIISGAVIMGDLISTETLQNLSECGYKCILVNQLNEYYGDNILLLNTENFHGSYDAVKTLIELGHTKIAHIAGSMEKASTMSRYAGYCQCLKDNNIPLDPNLVVYTNIHCEEGGYNTAKDLIQRNKDSLPTAIFCSNDLMGIGALRAMKELNINVPKEISLIGFDNAEISKYSDPPLSTVETNTKKIATVAAKTLISFIQGDVCEEDYKIQIITDYNVILRESIADLTTDN